MTMRNASTARWFAQPQASDDDDIIVEVITFIYRANAPVRIQSHTKE